MSPAYATGVLTLALVLFPVLAADARAQQLLEIDGIELRGEAQLVMSGGGTCNVLESDTSYEAKKDNHGAPMDIWRLDFTVRNGSGRWLDHLIARFQIDSEWPECTNWDGPDAGTFEQPIEWADSIGHIQESGRNVVAPGRTLTETRYFIVLRGDPEPRFSNWSMDFDFAAAPPTSDSGAPDVAPTASAEQETVFWQSIVNSTNPADFEAYLEQFPNGVFRRLAENQLSTLREQPERTTSGNAPRVGSPTNAADDVRLPTPGWSIDFGDDTGNFVQDGECDDARFAGEGMGLPSGVSGQRGRDATDCRQRYEAGRIRLFGVDLDLGNIDFGDDTSEWARDGDCDDPRFEGDGMAAILVPSDRGHDATDCGGLYSTGRIRLFGVTTGGVR